MTPWDVDRKVLQAVYEITTAAGHGTGPGATVPVIAERADVPERAVEAAIPRLRDAFPPYIAVGEGDLSVRFGSVHLTERGMREVGAWPAGPEQFVQALQQALLDVAEATDDPVERSRLREVAGMVSGFSRDVAVQITANLTTGGFLGGF